MEEVNNVLLRTTKRFLLEGDRFCRSTNYYFETHDCPAANKQIQVMMDHKIKDETNNDIVKIGMCEWCKTVFYHEDYES